MSTSGQYLDQGCSVHWGDIMIHVGGGQVDKSI